MRRTMLRLASLASTIAFAFGLLAVAEPLHAQGFNNFGGMGGGFGRGKREERGGGGGNFSSGPKGFSRDGGGPRESFGGPKGMPKDIGRGMSMGDAFKGRGPRGMEEHGPKNKFPDGFGSRMGREDDKRGRWGKIEGNGGPGMNGRFPKRDTQNSDNPKFPGGKHPFPKRDTASDGGNPKHPWPGRNPKGDGKSQGTDQASTGNPGSGPKYPWPNRGPKGGGKSSDQASTGGMGKPPQGGDVGNSVPPVNPPCRGKRCGGTGNPTQTGGGDDVPTGNPPCRGKRCGDTGNPTQTGGGDDVPTGNPPCWGKRCGDTGNPTQTGGGDDVPTGNPPCRGKRCGDTGNPTQTGDGSDTPPYGEGCRGRNCGDGRPPRRPPVIVIGPVGPMIPPPDYSDPDYSDEDEPPYAPPGYTPPYTATPVYEPVTPSRERPPVRETNRATPPSPPSGALPTGPAPMPMRRAFVTAAPPLYRPNEVLVTVQGAQPDAVAGQLAQTFNLVIEESQAFVLLQDRRVYRFRIPDNRGVEEVLASITGAPGVAQSLPNYYHYLQGGSAGAADMTGLQYALPKLRVPDTQDLVSGRGVMVAVIDSGVDTGHPALQKASIQVYDAVDGGVKDPDQHGTAITGIIAGKGEVNGIAPGVKILAIRAFAPERLGAAPVTTSMALARATDVAFSKGARVVNMSFAGPRDDLLLSLIDAAYAKGVVFIAAAGNQGPKAPPAYPAAYEKVIGITATDEDDGLYAMANRGNYISIAAPGVDILVPVVGKALDYMSGTSFAAAHISGIAALLIERNPKLSPEDVHELLLDAAHDLGQTGRDDDFGAGLADAYGAVDKAAGTKVQSSSINP